ncbi:MAG: MBL fold metallo-hydrolase [bacterium]|nr:MBL fold metallo-hydrolase [bacterium]
MKLTILGSGTCASGLPGIADRFPPAFLVESGKDRILFDCGEAVRFRLKDFETLSHIAISHAHPDHFALAQFYQSVFCTRKWKGIDTKNHEINMYCPAHIAENFPQYWRFYLSGERELDFPWPKLIFHDMSKKDAGIGIGEMKLEAKKVYHSFGEADALAFRLETPLGIFTYSGDTGLCQGIKAAALGADIFLCEASARIGNNQAASNYGHLNPFQAGQIAKEAHVKKLILFHYTGLDSDEAMVVDCRRSGFEGEIVIGKDNQEFVLA